MRTVTQPTADSIDQLLRSLTPQVIGIVARRHGDFAAAEDAVQEASLTAAINWSKEGLPDNPLAWLAQVALRRMIDQIRSDSARRRREGELLETQETQTLLDESSRHDDTLVLLFMCCHPSLSNSSAIALTLRAIGGLTTAEIANAFLVPEATMAQRISRAKQTIKSSGSSFELPELNDRPERLRTVLHVLYLIFNEGYTASSGEVLNRTDLSREGIRLTQLLHQLQPDNTEVAGLLALMLLTDARRVARTNADGELIPLAAQDRSLWDKKQIAEGVELISKTLPKGQIGPYQVQAAIAAIHDEAERTEDTDWEQILALYTLLSGMSENPMIELNRAIAIAMVDGPVKGLELLEQIAADPRLAKHHRLFAVRAHLLELAGEREDAIEQYRVAAERTRSLPERNYLLTQAAKLAK